VRRALALTAVIVATVGIAVAIDPEGRDKGDCGVSGVAPHPEIGGELVYNCTLRLTHTGFYVLDVATGIARPLIVDGAWNTDPAWSPDGRRLAYVSTKDGETDIYVLELESGHVTRLTDDGSWNGNPTWSPDGAWVMYDSSRDGTNPAPDNSFRNLFVVRADGTERHRVTALPGYNGTPTWSRDGKTILFASNRSGTYKLYTMDLDGSNATLLTYGGGYGRWSADGRTILFAATEPGDVEVPDAPNSVRTISVDGKTSVRLTSAGDDWRPDWSPDERWIAFARKVGDNGRQIFVIPAAGGDPVRLTWDETVKDWARWRPR